MQKEANITSRCFTRYKNEIQVTKHLKLNYCSFVFSSVFIHCIGIEITRTASVYEHFWNVLSVIYFSILC